MEDILAIVLIFGGGSAFLLAISPIGQAIAARIRSSAPTADETVRRLQDGQQALLEDLEALRQELTEVQERLDFAERLLAQQRDAGRLPHGSSAPPAEGS